MRLWLSQALSKMHHDLSALLARRLGTATDERSRLFLRSEASVSETWETKAAGLHATYVVRLLSYDMWPSWKLEKLDV